MAHYNITAARGAGIFNRISGLLNEFSAKMRARRIYRETLHGLSALSTRELDDLGLNRSELRRVSWEAACKAT